MNLDYISIPIEAKNISFDDYGILVGALKHALSTLLIKYYKNWVSYAIRMKESRLNDVVDLKSVIAPLLVDFVVKYNKNNQEANLMVFNIKN